MFQDSFFAPDSRQDSLGQGEFGEDSGSGRRSTARFDPPGRGDSGDEIGAVVVDTLPRSASRSHH